MSDTLHVKLMEVEQELSQTKNALEQSLTACKYYEQRLDQYHKLLRYLLCMSISDGGLDYEETIKVTKDDLYSFSDHTLNIATHSDGSITYEIDPNDDEE